MKIFTYWKIRSSCSLFIVVCLILLLPLFQKRSNDSLSAKTRLWMLTSLSRHSFLIEHSVEKIYLSSLTFFSQSEKTEKNPYVIEKRWDHFFRAQYIFHYISETSALKKRVLRNVVYSTPVITHSKCSSVRLQTSVLQTLLVALSFCCKVQISKEIKDRFDLSINRIRVFARITRSTLHSRTILCLISLLVSFPLLLTHHKSTSAF